MKDGHLLGFIGLGNDLTSRKLLESHFENVQHLPFKNELSSEAPSPQNWITACPPVTILTDSSGTVRHLSASGVAAFGYSLEEVVDRLNLLHLIAPVEGFSCSPLHPGEVATADREFRNEALNRLTHGFGGHPVEVLCRTKADRLCNALFFSTPLGHIGSFGGAYSCTLLGLGDGKSSPISRLPDAPDCPSRIEPSGVLFQFDSQGSKITSTCIPRSAIRLLGLRDDYQRPFDVRQCLSAFNREERRRLLERFKESSISLKTSSITVRLESQSRWLRIDVTPEALPGCRLRWHGFISDDSIRALSQIESSRHRELLELVVEVTTIFVDSPFSQMDRLIDKALASVGRFFGVDRAFLFEYDLTTSTGSNTHEWVSEGTEPFKEILRSVSLEGFEDWTNAHREGEPVNIPDVDSLPDGIARQTLQMQDIKSVLSVPLMRNQECIGFHITRQKLIDISAC